MRRMGVMAVALTAVLAVGCNRDNRAANDSAVGTAGRADSKVGMGDRDFIRDVATMNMAEIELSRTAAQKSASADVKKFADMMVADHNAAGDKLKAFATQHQVELPAQLDDKHRDKGEKLAAKQGLEFDKDTLSKWKTDYQTRTASGTEKTKAEIEAVAVVAEKSDDPITMGLNQWAADTYPVAYAHLEAAKALRDAVRKRSTN